jgi:hypothetical protein
MSISDHHKVQAKAVLNEAIVNALLMEAMSLLTQMPIKHPQQGEYRDDLIRRIQERLK